MIQLGDYYSYLEVFLIFGGCCRCPPPSVSLDLQHDDLVPEYCSNTAYLVCATRRNGERLS
jgi:hypothetical protein